MFSVNEKYNTSLSSAWLGYHCYFPKPSEIQEMHVLRIVQIVKENNQLVIHYSIFNGKAFVQFVFWCFFLDFSNLSACKVMSTVIIIIDKKS